MYIYCVFLIEKDEATAVGRTVWPWTYQELFLSVVIQFASLFQTFNITKESFSWISSLYIIVRLFFFPRGTT